MHTLAMIAWTVGAIGVLAWGLLRVLQDLLERGPYDAPLIEEPSPEEVPGTWHADRETGRN